MVRRLFTPKWLGALAIAVIFAVACWFLGGWQWSKYEAKVERNHVLDAHYLGDPRPLIDVVDAQPLPHEESWTRVTATGSYDTDHELYVRNRPSHGVYGYEVLVPFTTSTGSTVVVDRGWVENSPQGADVLPSVPAAPSDPVTLTGWVRPGEASLGRDLPAGQLASINLDEVSAAIDKPVLGAYVVLESERTADGRTPERPEPLEEPDRSLGPHQAYAIQWYLTTVLGFALVGFGVRREENEALITAGKRTRKPPKPKRVSRWDEEDW